MGIIKLAVLGGFSGKAGTVIGSSWKGIAVMRGLTIAKKRQADGIATAAAGEILSDD